MKLTKKEPISEVFEFTGDLHVLITGGVGSVVLERSILESGFYPLSTNINGGVARFKLCGDCAYNGTISGGSGGAKYRFVADIEEGEAEIVTMRVR